MSEHLINLSCANCGAKLDVYDDMERFSCGYCGTELIVQRRGGTVALKAVTEAIKQVQIGTDKTAAELAIARHEKELQDLRKKRNYVASDEGLPGLLGCGCGVILAIIGLGLLAGRAWGDGVGFALVGGFILRYAYQRSKKESPQLKTLRDQVRQLEKLIAEKKRIANE
jgi:hypothetical protein